MLAAAHLDQRFAGPERAEKTRLAALEQCRLELAAAQFIETVAGAGGDELGLGEKHEQVCALDVPVNVHQAGCGQGVDGAFDRVDLGVVELARAKPVAAAVEQADA